MKRRKYANVTPPSRADEDKNGCQEKLEIKEGKLSSSKQAKYLAARLSPQLRRGDGDEDASFNREKEGINARLSFLSNSRGFSSH